MCEELRIIIVNSEFKVVFYWISKPHFYTMFLLCLHSNHTIKTSQAIVYISVEYCAKHMHVIASVCAPRDVMTTMEHLISL